MLKSSSLSKFLRQRGQVLVFYAVMIPTLFLFVGVGIDLGWYYLNVSRLQNAADAAAVAGAQALNFKEYKYKSLTDKYPANSPSDISTAEGDEAAEKYVVKNLGKVKQVVERDSEGKLLGTNGIPINDSAGYTVEKDDDDNWVVNDSEGNKVDNVTFSTKEIIADKWSRGGNSEVTMTPSLYKSGDNFYYVIHLTEKIQHLFMPGWFPEMDAPVVAVAVLSKTSSDTPSDDDVVEDPTPVIPRDPGVGAEQQLLEGDDILTRTYNLEDITVMRNWEWQQNATDKQYEAYMGQKKYSGKWNEYQDKTKDEKGKVKVVHYVEGNHYRTETVKVQPVSSDGTTTNGTDFDSLNLDFHPDVEYKFTEDWDIGYEAPEGLKQTYRSSYNGGYNLRIHSTFNFGAPYPVRSNAITEDDPEDALYVRVESEPIEQLSFKNQTFFSTVRQIFLNINQSNMRENDRPLVIYYDGPEQITANSDVRKSQPVILTLEADARIILFAPNSSVVIRGNGHQMQGYVIAQNFVQLKTADDFTVKVEDGVTRYFDKRNPSKEYFYIKEEDTFVDSNGNVQTKSLDSSARRDRYDDTEQPEDPSVIKDTNYEKVYKASAFNLSDNSYYDSFNISSLKRNIYTYLDNYKDDEKTNSVDMFFTKYRSSWIN